MPSVVSRRVQLAATLLAAAAASVSAEDVPPIPHTGEAEMFGTIELGGRSYEVEGGDILIDKGPAEAVEAPPVKGVQGLGNSAIDAQNSNRWPNLEVVYEIDWSLSQGAIDNLRDAIAAIEAETCLRFRECSGSGCAIPYALVSDDGTGRCFAEAGVNPQGQVNRLNIGTGCSLGNTIHELLHTLGILHEQSRSDRDSFITINTGNIISGAEPQFDIRGEEDVGPYDYGSIMHYGPTAFSSNGGNTIDAPSPWDGIIGQRNGLSAGDIATIDHIYGIVQGPFDTSFDVEIRCNDFWELKLHVLNYNPNNVNGQAYNQFNLYDTTTGEYKGYINEEGVFPTTLLQGHDYMVKHGVWNCKVPWQERRIYNIRVSQADVTQCTPSIQCGGELTVVEQQQCVTSCGIDKKTGDHMIMSYFGISVSPQKCHNGITKVEYLNTDSWPTNLFTAHFFPWRNIYCTAGAYNMVATIYFKDGPTTTRSFYAQECDDDVPLLEEAKTKKQNENKQ